MGQLLMAQALAFVKGIEELGWLVYGWGMVTVFLLAVLMGLMTAIPLGPVGATGMLYMMAGQRRAAKAVAFGCLLAELIIIVAAVGMGLYFQALLGHPPAALELLVGLFLAGFGSYLMLWPQIPKLGVQLSGILAFKVALFSPNNLAGVVAMMAFLGITRRMDGMLDGLLVVIGHLVGLAIMWLVALFIANRVRKSGHAERWMPWLVRFAALVLLLAGLALLAKVAVFDYNTQPNSQPVPVADLIEQI
ncbi:MAG: hypothetical protein EBQ80_04335 [Proteobacteria bacterium]|nr:hypothetical protein [Pseudomonadota bacterium]